SELDRAEAVVREDVDQIFGVYRLNEFDRAGDPLTQPRAFNYWRPQPGGSGTSLAGNPRRVKGLRVGLGRGVPVVIVASAGENIITLGALAKPRVFFSDSAASADAIAGTSAPQPVKTYYYAIVGVDVF